MKISIITVVYNAELYIKDCIESIIKQSYNPIEYVIVDGGSTDQTMNIIQQYKKHITHLISEKDKGLYDAINKGINLASGEVIGILNADDMLVGNNVIAEVAKAFVIQSETEAVYGDLNYIKPDKSKIVRQWRSRQAGFTEIVKGWMPAHPTLYIKRELFISNGNYALDMGTAADYDLILRFFHTYKLKATYLPLLMVNMRTGGASNKNIASLLNALKNDYKALKRNKIPNPIWVLFKKKLSKLSQF
ncbi:glycosyltransferase family 2 protein [Pedobacter agri]|uniref:glycosyltransferase family 2 protein n=1 Tax=Pedobacter agri TaxID=454586 RepID=UPI00292D646D|nr:glycosyltransferase family 2 protein [Pedobacter agri]